MAANEQVQKAIDKYNELHGNDSYEYDLEKMIESLMPNGQRIRDLMFLPELSSPISN
jgi:F0F1-type ATP synthase alpha subunit